MNKNWFIPQVKRSTGLKDLATITNSNALLTHSHSHTHAQTNVTNKKKK